MMGVIHSRSPPLFQIKETKLKALEEQITYESPQPFTFFITPPKELGIVNKKITMKKVGYRNNLPLQGRFTARYQYQVDGIEATKYFKNGRVKRLPTQKERLETERQTKIRNKIDTLKGLPLNLEGALKDELIKLAESIGIEPNGLTKIELISEIEKVLN
jgi:hypothetical protein